MKKIKDIFRKMCKHHFQSGGQPMPVGVEVCVDVVNNTVQTKFLYSDGDVKAMNEVIKEAVKKRKKTRDKD